MPGHKQRSNKALALVSILMCLGCGLSFTQSSATPSPLEDTQSPDMFLAGNAEDPAVLLNGSTAENTDSSDEDNAPQETPTPEATAVPQNTAVPDEPQAQQTADVSPDAQNGVWTPVDSHWYFMVDGAAKTGWLTDTDGKRYYFDENGVMQTGWLKLDEKQYYLDADGVVQTGDVTLDGKIYHFAEDGSLQGDPVDIQDDDSASYIFYMNPDANTSVTPSSTVAAADPAAATPSPEAVSTPSAEPTVEPGSSKMIALTFDDGPSDFTDRLLDCLEANNAKATFFLVGKEIQSFPEPVSRMEALGCEIGNHSYDHTDLTTLSAEDVSSQLSATDQEIQDLAGHAATVVRPPYGAINDTVSSVVGRPMILWSVDTLDWETQNVDTTVQNVMDNAQDGAVILMHDIFKESVDAAEIFIPQLIEQGYKLVTIEELAKAKGVQLQAGVSYGAMTD